LIPEQAEKCCNLKSTKPKTIPIKTMYRLFMIAREYIHDFHYFSNTHQVSQLILYRDLLQIKFLLRL